jgi:hypothetical protein
MRLEELVTHKSEQQWFWDLLTCYQMTVDVYQFLKGQSDDSYYESIYGSTHKLASEQFEAPKLTCLSQQLNTTPKSKLFDSNILIELRCRITKIKVGSLVTSKLTNHDNTIHIETLATQRGVFNKLRLYPHYSPRGKCVGSLLITTLTLLAVQFSHCRKLRLCSLNESKEFYIKLGMYSAGYNIYTKEFSDNLFPDKEYYSRQKYLIGKINNNIIMATKIKAAWKHYKLKQNCLALVSLLDSIAKAIDLPRSEITDDLNTLYDVLCFPNAKSMLPQKPISEDNRKSIYTQFIKGKYEHLPIVREVCEKLDLPICN